MVVGAALDLAANAKRKIGPLEAWQWGVVVGGGYLGYRLITGKGLPGLPSLGAASSTATDTGGGATGGFGPSQPIGGPSPVGGVGYDPGSSPGSGAPIVPVANPAKPVGSTAPRPTVTSAPSASNPATVASQLTKTVSTAVKAPTAVIRPPGTGHLAPPAPRPITYTTASHPLATNPILVAARARRLAAAEAARQRAAQAAARARAAMSRARVAPSLGASAPAPTAPVVKPVAAPSGTRRLV